MAKLHGTRNPLSFELDMSRGTSGPATYRSPGAYWLQRGCLLMVMAASLGASVLFAPPALATGPPVIESMMAGAGSEVTVGANIDPEGLETTYEIWLECASCNPSDQHAAGSLPAVNEVRAVTLVLKDWQSGRYEFTVRASNAAGEAPQRSDIFEVPPSPGSFPTGAAPVETVEAPYLGDSTDELLAITEQENRERNDREAKEQEERRAEERIPSSEETSERRYREEVEAVSQQRASVCVVPSLAGDTPSAAARALAKAHCGLGKIIRLGHQRGRILVTRQSPRPGEVLPAKGKVTLTLGAKHASRR